MFKKENTAFNYIITVHNKEILIKDVILSVISCMGENSTIYPILDGCTDCSEEIIDQLITEFPEKRIVKLYADDVHELKSINVGLSASNQDGLGFNIVLQDDVLIKDTLIEDHCLMLFNKFKNLGVVSFRHGGNLSRKLLTKNTSIKPIVDYVENEMGHNPDPFYQLKIGSFIFKEVAIKSPICIPCHVIREVGMPDEIYAPWDDLAYCYNVAQSGFHNGVYALDFQSDVEWGTTRKKKQTVGISEVEKKNLKLFKLKNKIIAPLNANIYSSKRYQIFDNGKVYKASYFLNLVSIIKMTLNTVKIKFKILILK